MAIDRNPTPPPERPADPFTAKDGAQLYSLFDKFQKDVLEQLRGLSNRVAAMQGNQLDIMDLLTRVESGLSSSRSGRLDAELKEAELEREVAERTLRALEEKLNIKREVKDKTLDTEQKIQTVASTTYANLEEKRRAERDAKIEELKWNAIKAVVGALSVAGSFSIIAFLWWLFQQYINRGGQP